MAKTSNKSLKERADIIRQGRQIVVPAEPKPMSYAVAAGILLDREEAEQAEVRLNAVFKTLPYPGMIAFTAALERLFGFTLFKELTVKGFFGPQAVAPVTQTVPVGPDEHKQVVWADYAVPGTTIKLRPTVVYESGIALFALEGECKQMDRPVAEELYEVIRQEIKERSPLSGRAFRLKMDNLGKLELGDSDAVQYIRTNPQLRHQLILHQDTLDQIETEVFTPVEDYDFLKTEWGMDMNRVVLLSGPYGTGKSMTMAAMASVVAENGGTFILLDSVAALQDAIRFTRVLELRRVTICAEDIDRIMSGDRDQDKDTVGNMISGVQSSTTEMSLIVTTNDIEKIHPFMIRRFNAVVEFRLPDAVAVERLIRLYGGDLVQGDLTEAPKALAGNMPSLIKDVVGTAKLSARRFKREHITDQDLLVAARQIQTRARLAERKLEPEPAIAIVQNFGKLLRNGEAAQMERIVEMVDEIHDRLF